MACRGALTRCGFEITSTEASLPYTKQSTNPVATVVASCGVGIHTKCIILFDLRLWPYLRARFVWQI
jgi:hypothetical protein